MDVDVGLENTILENVGLRDASNIVRFIEGFQSTGMIVKSEFLFR